MSLLVAAAASAQPVLSVNGVLNAASSALADWPDSSIAQGSIFSIYGSSLGPSSSPTLAYPLQTSLGGVSIQVNSAGATYNAIPIFVGPTQINAVLPDGTPTGAATLTVTYNGQTNNAVSFQVIASSFGIFAVNSTGFGVGVITGAKYQLYSVNSPANPGSAATIWGTGLGTSPGDDGSSAPPQIDLSNLPLLVYVGTQKATVTYRGRGGFTAEDQINFVVPAGITDCSVPVVVQIGNIVSNSVTMPIAPAGQSCPDPAPPVPTLSNTGTALTGNITLIRTTRIGTTTSTTDYGQAFFGDPQLDAFPYVPPIFGNPYSIPVGTCLGSVTFPPIIETLAGPMDVGPITITGPNGSQEFTASGLPAQIGGGSGTDAQPLYLSAGTYTASAAGGTQMYGSVRPFSQSFMVPPPLTWTNEAAINIVDRSKPLDITWAGGDPNGTVQITGDIGFICNAKASDGHFTIPAFVLLSLAPSETPAGFFALTLGTISTTPFTASGITSGTVNTVVTIIKNVTYQ